MPIFPSQQDWLRLFLMFEDRVYDLTVAEAIWWAHYLALVDEASIPAQVENSQEVSHG